MIIRIIFYFLIIVFLIYAMLLYINNTVCDCKPCDFFSHLSSIDNEEDREKRLVELLQPLAYQNMWPCCLLAAVIITFVFSWFFPLLSVGKFTGEKMWLIDESVIFTIAFLFSYTLFSFIQNSYLNAITPLILKAYIEQKK